MGPTTILDKSAFQGLSAAEHMLLRMWFMENVTVVLMAEIQGDLAKQEANGAKGTALVKELANKFGGSGGVVNMDYMTMARQSLFGSDVPMTGQILPLDATMRRDEKTGGVGMYIGLSVFNEAILRWRRGEFTHLEDNQAKVWRAATTNLGFSALQQYLEANRVVLPRPSSKDAIVAVTDDVLREPGLSIVWLEWLMTRLGMGGQDRDFVLSRWKHRAPFQGLKTFAPYAYHCLRALVSLVVAVRHGYAKWQSTHILDVQYLYYLPFCQVFVSDDRIHRLLAPGLLRRNQVFIRAADLKADLRRMGAERAAIPEGDARRQMYRAGKFPSQPEGSVVQQAWDLCMGPGGFGADTG